MTRDMSSKYKNTILKSVLISSGPPRVYKLNPKKKMFGTLTKMTVGEKNQKQTNKTILLVGETGAGKSTLINSMVNYTMGVKCDDKVWFQIVEDEKRSQAESQTSDVVVYEIFGFEDETLPYSLTIIDTPGYGDTRGTEHDVIVSERLLDLFRSDDGVHEVHAVGLVMKASDNRLSDRLRYIFDSVISLFGKNLEKNIVALITHSDGVTPENALEALEAAKIKCARIEDEPVCFLFNNQQKKERKKKEKLGLHNAWRVSEGGMSEFSEFLENIEPQKLMTTAEVLNERIRLTACIQNLQERIDFIESKQAEIKQTQEALKKHEEEMTTNKEFTIEIDEVYKVREDIEVGWWCLLAGYAGAVSCKVCKTNCHYPGCILAWYPEHCKVMKEDNCTVCPKKCPASHHVKERKIYVTKTRRVKKTNEEMKNKYEKNKTESEDKSSLLENLEKEMNQLTAEKSQWLEESYQHVVRLEEIALNVFSLSTIVHLELLSEKMKEKGDTEKVQKLEEMRSRVDEGTRGALQYIPAVMKKFGQTLWNKMKTHQTDV
ncbi:septin-2B-like [Simochromis diagramma]|uniref:septin-2B-like n=1 Tax=Simochromis diagramma TaxID=43689 RepID=UPI001A7E73AD|nr:septin-2B-like [Simochromis diagramma]